MHGGGLAHDRQAGAGARTTTSTVPPAGSMRIAFCTRLVTALSIARTLPATGSRSTSGSKARSRPIAIARGAFGHDIPRQRDQVDGLVEQDVAAHAIRLTQIPVG
jgi:hypothetical protein